MTTDSSDQSIPARSAGHVVILLLLVAAFVFLLLMTIRASRVRGVFENGALMSDVWFQVTLVDTYLSFLTVFVWIAWKEQTLVRGVMWFILIMTLGNLAICFYLFRQVWQLPPTAPVHQILHQRSRLHREGS